MHKHHSRELKSLFNRWQIQEAKAKFSRVIEDAAKTSQIITKNGEPVAVIISIKEFDRLSKPKASLLEFFKQVLTQK